MILQSLLKRHLYRFAAAQTREVSEPDGHPARQTGSCFAHGPATGTGLFPGGANAANIDLGVLDLAMIGIVNGPHFIRRHQAG